MDTDLQTRLEEVEARTHKLAIHLRDADLQTRLEKVEAKLNQLAEAQSQEYLRLTQKIRRLERRTGNAQEIVLDGASAGADQIQKPPIAKIRVGSKLPVRVEW